MYNISPAAFQKWGERQEVPQRTLNQDWQVTGAPQAQAAMLRLHETGLAESNQTSSVDRPFALENKKLHPLESHLKKKKFYH